MLPLGIVSSGRKRVFYYHRRRRMLKKRIITRFPNLECGIFQGLLDYSRRTRENLGFTSGEIEIVFQSTNHEGARDPDAVYFNTGRRDWDQHGQPENATLCSICSLDLVRGDYDFLKRRPWLPEIYEKVRQNDIKGTRISNHPRNLRELMNGLTAAYPEDPKLVLEWLSLAFCGVFENVKNGVNIKKIFDPEILVKGVNAYDPEKSEWFQKLLFEAQKTVSAQEDWARKAIAKAEEFKRTSEVMVPAIGAKVKLIEVLCDSIKTGPIARKAGYHIVVQWNRDDHVQIHGGIIKIGEAKFQLDLAPLVAKLRQVESDAEGMVIDERHNLQDTLCVRYADGRRVPWFFPEFRTSIYNGTLSSKDVAPTKIERGELFDIIKRTLPRCSQLAQNDPGEAEAASGSE